MSKFTMQEDEYIQNFLTSLSNVGDGLAPVEMYGSHVNLTQAICELCETIRPLVAVATTVLELIEIRQSQGG